MKTPSNKNKFSRKPRKMKKGIIPNTTFSNSLLDKGDFGLKAISPGRITANEIETARRVLVRSLSKSVKIFIRIFPHKSITSKPAEVRMGGGKGSPDYFAAIISPGCILFEVEGISEKKAKEAFKLVSYKLSIFTSMIRREI